MRRPASHKKITDPILHCRTFAHQWDDVTGITERGTRRRTVAGVYIVMRCLSCGAIRRDTISPSTGSLLLRQYTRPDGYAVSIDRSKGTPREQMRMEYIARRG